MAVDWLRIKSEYVNGGVSYRELSEKYGVSQSAIRKKAAAEKWTGTKTEQLHKIGTTAEQKTVDKISDALSDEAAAKVRIRAKIYAELENRLNEAEVGSADFRRLVQSYKDMCEIQDDSKQGDNDRVMVIIDV